ncbi:MAG: hypothetical protein IKG25_05795 [Mogibacterium sp.]|nr:hypothetical protein [Mogibacterium sp.]MBR4090407.1 hypothetical protein [Mogibacterium sp.]
MRKGKTKTGFSFHLDPTDVQDMCVLDYLADVLDPESPEIRKIISMSKLTEKVLGQDQKKALYNHIAEKHDGKVPPAVLEAELTDILSGNETKN